MLIPKDNFAKMVGKKISTYREKKGLSQAELARRCNKDRQAIERLEKGRVNPNTYTLYEISKALNINTKRLLDF